MIALTPETSAARLRERIATRRRLNAENRRQNQEVKKNLQKLRAFFEAEIPTVSPEKRPVYQQMLDHVVSKLEHLEDQDESTQGQEGAIVDWEARQIPSQRRPRP